MANTIPFKDEIYNSALKELFNTVSEKPYIMPEITERQGIIHLFVNKLNSFRKPEI